MAAPESRRILRMGVIQNGAIIEERLFRKIEPISVGTHFKNTFSITTPRAPQAFTFFDVMGGRYVLNFIDSMEGRLSVGGTVHSLQSLKQHKKAVNRGKHWSIPLDERSRGKIVVGDVIFLFQFVTPPPAKLTPQLPIALRGGPLTFLNNTVELTGTFGYASDELNSLFDPKSELWRIAAGGMQSVFDAGKLAANQHAAEARYEQALADYAKTVLLAFGEVEGSLLNRKEKIELRNRLL